MKKIALILLSLTITLTAGWWRTYGDEGDETGRCIQITDDGGYIVTGYPWGLLKLDERGNILWQRSWSVGGSIGGNCVQKTSDNGYIICNASGLIKTDDLGDTSWTRELSFNPSWVEETSDGGYIVTGKRTFEDGSDMYLLKTDTAGERDWLKVWLGHSDVYNRGYCVQQTKDEGFIISAVCIWGDFWLLKTDSMGEVLWEVNKMINPGCACWALFVRETKDGNFIVTGDYNGNAGFLYRFNSVGDSLWLKIYEGCRGNCVQITSDGGYLITGATGRSNQNLNLWLMKTDSSGNTIWTKTYGGEESDIGWSVQQSSDGGYIVVGSTESYGAGGWDIYLLKTDSLGIVNSISESRPETHPTFEVVTAVGEQIVLRFSLSENRSQGEERSHLGIFDASGRLVDELILKGPTTISWGDGFSPGVYFIREMGGNSATQKAVLIR